ncbi:MAG: hypothetical protein LBH63_00330 [Clostridiales Family XIII bacterium]|jgi:hypothetical protein|nr:hypothetical protein [Clostridiales Family XIII bacterium]
MKSNDKIMKRDAKGKSIFSSISRATSGKRALLPIFSVVLSACLLLGSTYAWLRASDSVTNRIHAPQYLFDVPVFDAFVPPSEPIKPGDDPFEKKVGAENRGDLPGFVRLLALPTVVAADGLTVLPARMGEEIVADINTADWVDGGDGYYYYLKKLPAKESTTRLFTGIRLAENLDARYKRASLKIEVKCEAAGTGGLDYRMGWWGSEAPPSDAKLLAVDNVLRELVN